MSAYTTPKYVVVDMSLLLESKLPEIDSTKT